MIGPVSGDRSLKLEARSNHSGETTAVMIYQRRTFNNCRAMHSAAPNNPVTGAMPAFQTRSVPDPSSVLL